MNERIALRRTSRRQLSSGGYTLIELMVVVVLIAILAMMAAPSFVVARADRLTFSYARTVGDLVHNARARAMARGAAHLFVYTDAYGARGTALVFEALDGTTDASGPNPVPGCKGTGQWTDAANFVAGNTSKTAAVIDGLNINDTTNGAIEIKENIKMIATASVAPTPKSFVICTTPSGTTYYGAGADVATAITNMQNATTPFTDIVEIDVARRDAADLPVGLNRRVLITGGAAPRIKSE